MYKIFFFKEKYFNRYLPDKQLCDNFKWFYWNGFKNEIKIRTILHTVTNLTLFMSYELLYIPYNFFFFNSPYGKSLNFLTHSSKCRVIHRYMKKLTTFFIFYAFLQTREIHYVINVDKFTSKFFISEQNSSMRSVPVVFKLMASVSDASKFNVAAPWKTTETSEINLSFISGEIPSPSLPISPWTAFSLDNNDSFIFLILSNNYE